MQGLLALSVASKDLGGMLVESEFNICVEDVKLCWHVCSLGQERRT